MPEMDGIELAQKAAELVPDIRVMFITGFAAVALKAGRKTPDAKVLSKPFHLKDLGRRGRTDVHDRGPARAALGGQSLSGCPRREFEPPRVKVTVP